MGVSNDAQLIFGIDMEEFSDFLEDYDGDFDSFVAQKEELAPSIEFWEYLKTYPVSWEMHCSYEYPMYILSIPGYQITASRGYPDIITAERLLVPQEKIDSMKTWCEKYNVPWVEPKWLLCSMNG